MGKPNTDNISTITNATSFMLVSKATYGECRDMSLRARMPRALDADSGGDQTQHLWAGHYTLTPINTTWIHYF